MPRQDFYVTFGSDIVQFNAGLLKELAQTEKIVTDFEKRINKIGSGAATSPLGKMLDQISKAQTQLHEQAGTGKAVPAGTGAAEIHTAMEAFTSELRKLLAQVKGAKGTGTPTARDAPTTTSTPRVTEAPKGVIDDAAFTRMIAAIDRNIVSNTRLESAINRLAQGGLGKGGAIEQGKAAAAQAYGAPRDPTKWDTLSDPVRRRLQNAGITQESYAAGVSTRTAYGHARELQGDANAAPAATTKSEGNAVEVLQRILAQLTSLSSYLRNRAGRRAAPERNATKTKDVVGEANSEESQSARVRSTQFGASKDSAEAYFQELGRIRPELRDIINMEDKLAAAVRLVTTGTTSQRVAVDLLGQAFGRTRKEATEALSTAVASSRVSATTTNLAAVAAAARAKQLAKQAAVEAGDQKPLGPARPSDTQWAGMARASKQAADETLRDSNANASAATTLARVSGSARAAVEALRELVRAGAGDEAIAKAQARAYALLNQELKQAKVAGPERNQNIADVFRTTGSPVTGNQLGRIRQNSLNLPSGAVGEAAAAGGRVGDAMGNAARDHFSALFGNQGFYSRVMHTVGTFLVRNFAAGAVFGITNELRGAIEQAITTESTFVRVSQALDQTGRSSAGLRTQLQGLSQDYGVALKDVYTTAAGLTGLFDKGDVGNQRLVDLTKTAVELELISGGALNATEAMRSLASITSAYGEEAPKHMADVLTAIQNQLSVNVEDSIEGVARLSGMAKLMGIDFEHAATYVASISKFTGQSGAASGEQFSRMLEEIQKAPTQKVITKALLHPETGPAVNVRGAFQARDYQGAIDALLGSYSRLSRAQQSQVSIAIGGARQAAATNAFLIEGSKTLNTITVAYHSNGDAQQRAAAISDQLNAQIKRLRTAFVNFFAALERMGLLNAFGEVLKTVRFTLDHINDAVSWLNDQFDKSPITRVLRTWITTFGGLVIGITLARKAWAGLSAAMAAARGAAGIAAVGRAAAAGAPLAAAGTAGTGAASQAGLAALLFGGTGTQTLKANFDPRVYSGLGGREGPILPPAMLQDQFGRVGPTGVPYTAGQRFYARRAVGLDSVAGSLGERSAALKEAAQARIAATEGLASSKLMARSMQAAALALQGLGSAAGGLSTGMGFLARHANGVNLAMGGVGAIALTLYSAYQRNKEASDKLTAIFNALVNTAPKQSDNPTKEQTGVSALDDWLKTNKKRRQPSAPGGNDGPFSAFLSPGYDVDAVATIGKSILQGIGDTFSGKHPGAIFTNTWNRLTGNISADKGETTSSQDKKYFTDPLHQTYNTINSRLMGTHNSVAEVDKVIKLNEKQVIATLKAIENDPNASKAQKAVLARDVLRFADQQRGILDSYRLTAEGISNLDSLTQDQLDAIGPMVAAITSFGSNASHQFTPLLKAYIEQVGGFAVGSTYDKQFDRLAAGGVTHTRTRIVGKIPDIPGVTRPGLIGATPDPAHATDIPGVTRPGLIGATPEYPVKPPPVPVIHTKTTTSFKPDTPEQRESTGLQILKTAALAAQSKVAGMTEAQKVDDTGQKYIQSAFTLMGMYYQAAAQQLQNELANAQAITDLARLTGNYGAAAQSAGAQVAALTKQLKAGDIKQGQYNLQVAQINATAAQDRATGASAGFDLAKSQTRNAVASASLELQSAQATLRELQHGGSANDKQQAAIRVNQAALALGDAQAEARLAALATFLDANTAPGDAVAQANAKLRQARATQADAAARFGTNSTQYQQATQGIIDTQREITKTVNDVAQANYNLAIAYANASGYTVRAANLTLAAARRKLRDALKNSGGNTNTTEVKDARSTVVQAEAAARDAKLQDSLDTINFNRNMNYITSASAIHELQELLKQKNLTRAQRRDIMLQIHGLQMDLVSSLTSSGFNIPGLGDLKLPSPYEVRRSLGVDKMQKALRDAVNVHDGGFSLGAMQANTASVSPLTSGGANVDLINAVKDVRTAIQSNGATKVNVKQDNHFNTPTVAAAKAIAYQVIQIINQQTSAQARASTSTPRHVPTR